MNHCMLDLETLGVEPGCPILSIGAVYWEPTTGELGQEFYCNIQISDSLKNGFTPNGATVEWWLTQSDEARGALFDHPKTVAAALIAFSNFVASPKDCIWGNGPGFDNAILKAAYEQMGIEVPWYFRGDRDMRTLKTIAGLKGILLPSFIREGTYHHALDDAKHQVEICSYIIQRL